MSDSKKIDTYLGFIGLAVLSLGSLLIIRPFLSAVLLAVIFTISTWPLYEKLLGILKGRKTLAAAIVSLGLAILFLAPVGFLVTSIGGEGTNFAETAQTFFAEGQRNPPPEWLQRVPVVGPTLIARWDNLTINTSELMNKLRPYVATVSSGLFSAGAALGGAVIELCVALIISFLFFRDGLVLADKLRTALTKLAGTRAEGLIRTAGFTLKSVVYGILGTAFVQGVLATIGFLIAGVPTAMLLGLITSFLSLIPIGPPLIWGPACLWLMSEGQTGWAVFLALWGIIAISGSDNFIKPYLISKGTDLPIVLIFVGVIGGALQFGFMGVFLGPTLLALSYSLLKEWIKPPVRESGPHLQGAA